MARSRLTRSTSAGKNLVLGAVLLLWSIFFAGVQSLVEGDLREYFFAQVHENDVDRETMQPGGKRGVAAKGCDFAIELEKGVLGKILGLLNISGHAETEGVDTPFMQAVQSFEALESPCRARSMASASDIPDASILFGVVNGVSALLNRVDQGEWMDGFLQQNEFEAVGWLFRNR